MDDTLKFDNIEFEGIKRELDVLSGEIVKQYERGIIVNENTYQRRRDQFEFRHLDRIAADERSPAFDLYEVYSLKGNIKKLSDMPSKIMLERCVRYAESPTPYDWDGTDTV